MQTDPKTRDVSAFKDLSLDAILATSLPEAVIAKGGLVAARIETPLGSMVAITDQQSLYMLEFLDRRIFDAQVQAILRSTGTCLSVGETAVTEGLRDELAHYFDGGLSHFKTPLSLNGTPFVEAVWRALLEIPAGSTQSYGALAQSLNNPKAVRAVAQANGANRLAVIVPCHRVIGADGSLTGYGGGAVAEEVAS